jgi:hypothetical protein
MSLLKERSMADLLNALSEKKTALGQAPNRFQ